MPLASLAVAALAVSYAAPAAPAMPARPSAPVTTSAEAVDARDEILYRIEHDARRERRERLTSGAVQVVAGGLQTALGMWLLIDPPSDDDSVQVAGILGTAAGGGNMLQGALSLGRRGPLEVMVRDPQFQRAKRSPAGDAWIEHRLQRGARRGRIERVVAGSLGLAGGLVIIGLGLNNLMDDDLRDDPAQVVLGASQIGAALGFSTFGVRLLAVPSQAEHTLDAWKHRSRAARVRSLSVSPGVGGLNVSGRF